MAKTSEQMLVDSDVFVAWLMPDDLLHKEAEKKLSELEKKETPLVMTNWVLAETATVLSYRAGHRVAVEFLENMERMGFEIAWTGEKAFAAAVNLFKRQKKRGTSMVDCINVAVAKERG